MTRSPLFSSNLFCRPTLSNWVTWNNWEKVWKNANTTFLRRFHQRCRYRILRSLLNTERIFGATFKFTDYFIDCYKYFTLYIFIISISCNYFKYKIPCGVKFLREFNFVDYWSFFALSMNKFSRIIKYWEQVPGFNDIIVFSLAEKTFSFLFHKGDIETRFNILQLKNHTL